jgi:hypothetical protein
MIVLFLSSLSLSLSLFHSSNSFRLRGYTWSTVRKHSFYQYRFFSKDNFPITQIHNKKTEKEWLCYFYLL